MATLQNLPYLGTAEDDVLFVEWLVPVGTAVAAGQRLATVETLKAAFDVEADAAGVLLRQLCAPGERIAVQAAIGVLGAAGEVVDEAALQRLLAGAGGAARVQVTTAPAVPTVAPVPFTAAAPAGPAPIAPAAKQRALELRLDLGALVGTGPEGLVRVADVERAHAAAQPVPASPLGDPAADGRVDAAFLALVKQDERAFAALSGDFKLQLYRRHGARLGKDCRLGAGSVLRAARLVLGDGAFIGPDCTIEAQDLEAGPLLHFGARCRVRCTTARFGENAFFADDVEIGGGGAMEPEAELLVGSHGFVGEHVHLNPCRTLRLGDEVVVSRSAVVMTHSFGPSWLRGYPSRFAGVEIGDGAQIGIQATLFPGVQVGAGAVILSGSSVVTAVPAGRLFGGVPAIDLKAAAQQLTPAQVAERAQALVAEFARQLHLRGLPVMVEPTAGGTQVTVRRDDGEHRLEFAPQAAFAPVAAAAERVLVAVEFPDAEFAGTAPNVTAIGLEPPRLRGPVGPLGGAFREFLRKRGVRLHPRAWAYTGGWL